MVVVMEETIRIRLSFEDDEDILSPSQKSVGLNRCWLLLKPQQHNTVADLTAHILHAFQLQHSCPHGLYLYMDGFALPPFESTGILKNSEMISVRKKTATLSIEANLEGQEAGVTQPVKAGTLLLANKEFQEETGGYLSDELEYEYREPEDKEEADKYVGKDQLRGLEGGKAISKKRKASTNPHKSKKKKQRSALQDSVQDDATANQVLKSSQDKVRSSQENIQKQEHDPKNKKQAKNGKEKITNGNMETSADPKSSDEIQNSANEALEGPLETKKISRSARRKKAKRQWLRELVKVEKRNEIVQNGLQYSKETLTLTKVDDNSQPKSYQREEQTQPKSGQKNRKGKRDDGEPKGLLHWKSSSAKDKLDDKRKNEEADQNGSIHEQANQHSNTDDEVVPAVVRPELNQCNNHQSDRDDEVVPVVIRPGHIRFEPLEKDEDVEQSKKSREHFIQWNGITNKKKGQKWGKEKHVHSIFSNRKDYYETQELDAEVLTIEDSMEEVETEALTEQDQTNKVGAEVLSAHNELHLDNTTDFDKLPPLCNLPKAGDVIVYRLLELSSSWTPELSPFRVGKVSWCSSETGKLLLMPVPEYPISSGMSIDDESDPQPDNSLYNEDGSLEIDFTALVDVRLLKDGSGGLTSAEKAFGLPVDDAALVVPSASNDNVSTKNGEAQPGKLKNGSSTENGVDIWEQVNEALKAKKAQLSHERTENAWSYRTLKGSALGPTMALLRSNNKL